MTADPRVQLSAKMLVCSYTVRDLLNKIHVLEEDTKMPLSDKLVEIRKIRSEIEKVGTEIDGIKRSLRLLETYSVN
jgi:hypothetical protein